MQLECHFVNKMFTVYDSEKMTVLRKEAPAHYQVCSCVCVCVLSWKRRKVDLDELSEGFALAFWSFWASLRHWLSIQGGCSGRKWRSGGTQGTLCLGWPFSSVIRGRQSLKCKYLQSFGEVLSSSTSLFFLIWIQYKNLITILSEYKKYIVFQAFNNFCWRWRFHKEA